MRVRWQLFIVIILILVAIFASTNTNRFLSEQEASQTKYTQERLASMAQQILPTVEAQSPQTLQIQKQIQFGTYDILRVVCDTDSGNQYVTYRSYGNNGGIALQIVPNGCQKNSR